MRRRSALLASVTVFALVAGIGLAANSASAVTISRCGSSIDSRPIVITVHGFRGDFGKWNESGPNGSMNDSIAMVSRVNLVNPFNYGVHSLKWVTDSHIGPAIAEKINCLSDASKEAGGDGRVIVVAHSMGGLALREALNQASAVHVKPEKIGLAIMLGTPHNGSDLGFFGGSINLCMPSFGSVQYSCMTSPAIQAMSPGSRELAKLPKLPSSVALRAIAGDVVVSRYLWGRKIAALHYGDRVVKVASATGQYTTAYPGDGKFIFDCEAETVFGNPMGTSCDHGELPKNGQVQASVIQALGEYVNSLPGPKPTPSPTSSSGGGCEQPSPSATASEEAIGGVGGGPSEIPCPEHS